MSTNYGSKVEAMLHKPKKYLAPLLPQPSILACHYPIGK